MPKCITIFHSLLPRIYENSSPPTLVSGVWPLDSTHEIANLFLASTLRAHSTGNIVLNNGFCYYASKITHCMKRQQPWHLQFTPILQCGNILQLESKTKAAQPIHAGLNQVSLRCGWVYFNLHYRLRLSTALPQDNSRDRMAYPNSQYS